MRSFWLTRLAMAYSIVSVYLLLNIFYCTADEKNKTGLCMRHKLRERPRTSLQAQNYDVLAHDSDIFLDRSLFIKEFIEDVNNIVLISLPRRWGKSVNVDMIRLFFEIQMKPDGNRTALEKAKNYDLFMNGVVHLPEKMPRKLEYPPMISKDKDFVDKYLGKYPVVHVYLGFQPLNPVLWQTQHGILNNIIETFEFHKYMASIFDTMKKQKTQAGAAEELKRFQRHIHELRRMKDEEQQKSIVYLSSILYNHFKTKVIIVLDDYDMVLQHVVANDWFPDKDRETFINWYMGLLNETLNNNQYLEKAFVTGSLYPTEPLMTNIFSQVTHGNFLTGKYMEYFGINQHDMKILFDYHKTSEETKKEMIAWYGGYKINNRNLEHFSPWSVVHSLRRKRIEWFWSRTHDIQEFIHIALELLDFKAKFVSLLNGSEISISLKHEHFTWRDFIEVNRVYLEFEDATLHGEILTDRLFMQLFMNGYLTLSRNHDLLTHGTRYHFKIPNLEIKKTLMYDYEKFVKEGPKKWTGIRDEFEGRWTYTEKSTKKSKFKKN